MSPMQPPAGSLPDATPDAPGASDARGAKPRSSEPTTIKKYANRRLYHTGTSTYVTLDDLARMVKAGEDFVVFDARSGDDITRSVLTQIIFEQETAANAASGQSLLPVAFLKQLIRFYGDQMQSLVPSYLDLSLQTLHRERSSLREQMGGSFGQAAMEAMERQVRANIAMMQQAMRVFSPFGLPGGAQGEAAPAGGEGTGGDKAAPQAEAPAPDAGAGDDEMAAMKARLTEMERRFEALLTAPARQASPSGVPPQAEARNTGGASSAKAGPGAGSAAGPKKSP